MSELREATIKLNDWEMRYILESINKELAHLKHINATSNNEDEQADAGNDFMELSGLKERLESEATSTFGLQFIS